MIVNRGRSTGATLFDGTLARGETRRFDGRAFWVNLGAPENLVVRVAGKRVPLSGLRPWVLTVTPAGWRSHPA